MYENIYDVLNKISKILESNNLKISSAESITAGRFASLLTSIPGSSKYFDSALVTYSNNSKINLLKIDENVLNKHGAVSEEIANQMVQNLYNLTKTNICISFTGNAGPIPMEGKEVGLSFIGLKIIDLNITKIYKFKSEKKAREEIIWDSMEFILNELLEILRKFYNND